MKQLYAISSFLCLAALLAASCTTSLTDEPDTTARAIAFSTPQAGTRAAVNGTSLTSGSFSVWGWYGDNGTNDVNVFDGEKVTGENSVWTYDGGTRYWIPGKTYNFYAVHPAGVAEYDESSQVLTVDNFDCSKTGEEAVDLMTATTPGLLGSNASTVGLEFEHELARIKFTVKSENTVATVSSFKMYGVNYQGTLTKGATASWSSVTACTAGNTPYKLENFAFNTTNGFEKNVLGDVLLIPHTDLTNAKLEIAYRYQNEKADRISTIGLQTTDIVQWDAGKSYSYTLTIKGGELVITVNVVDWKEEDTSVSWG